MDYDFAIIGSGFGGSVAALRLIEKGYSVVVLEQGRQVTPEDMDLASRSIRKLFWMPQIGMKGFFTQNFFKHCNIVGGVGVGGGSIVYAAVLLQPKDAFYRDPSWSSLDVDWKKELSPHYKTVSKMLGVQINPGLDLMDDYLKRTAVKMNVGHTCGPTKNGIYFGKAETLKDDPFFGGAGPARMGCHLCGECLTGCKHGSKNTLDKNYLYLAQKKGAVILPLHRVTDIIPEEDGSYLLKSKDPTRCILFNPPIRAHKVIVAAGVLGTLELLFRCRDITRSLPGISSTLGSVVRTNSEAIVGALSDDPEMNFSHGTTISSDFYPDQHTHITQNRFPRGYGFMRWYCGPLVNDANPLFRALKTVGQVFIGAPVFLKNWFARNWHKRIIVLTVMQNLDNRISFVYGRSSLLLYLGRRLKSKSVPSMQAPTYLPVANRAAAILADELGGTPVNVIMESIMNQSTTAHILGGCHMGTSYRDGVIGTDHQVFNYPGLYIVDGASVSANVGVNPSLTIAAMSERAMGLIPSKKKAGAAFMVNAIPIQKRRNAAAVVKKIVIGIGAVIVVGILVTAINILQKGGGYTGESIEKILGVPADQVTPDMIRTLSKPQVMQLFYAASAPDVTRLEGEYRAELIEVGILAKPTRLFNNHIFGNGKWIGKAFSGSRGYGYNIFLSRGQDGKDVIFRIRKMYISIQDSEIDGKPVMLVDYQHHNGGLVNSMRDELRRVNDRLYIGMGHMSIGGGSINPAPFMVYGDPKPWAGEDHR